MDCLRLGEVRGLDSGYPSEELGMSIFSDPGRALSIDMVLPVPTSILSMTTGLCVEEVSSPCGMDGMSAEVRDRSARSWGSFDRENARGALRWRPEVAVKYSKRVHRREDRLDQRTGLKALRHPSALGFPEINKGEGRRLVRSGAREVGSWDGLACMLGKVCCRTEEGGCRETKDCSCC